MLRLCEVSMDYHLDGFPYDESRCEISSLQEAMPVKIIRNVKQHITRVKGRLSRNVCKFNKIGTMLKRSSIFRSQVYKNP